MVDKKSNFSKHATEILHKTRKVLVENKIDVVIVMGMAVSMTAIVSSLGLSTKTIICEHSSIYNKIYNNKVMKLNRLFACLLADKIVVLTDSCRAGYENKYYVSSKRLEVIPNWIEAELYRSPQYNLENKRIITVGRADPVKGYEKLIQVARIVRPFLDGWKWHIWGDFTGKYGTEIIEKVREEDLDNFICFMGTTENMYEKYRNYSLYVMTSLYEGLPMVLLEAKANKLPIISFDCLTGPSEIVRDKIDGELIPNGNAKKMAQRIISLIKNHEKMIQYSNEADGNLDKFSLETILHQWNQLLYSLT